MTELNKAPSSIGNRLRVDFAFSLVLIAAVVYVTRFGKGELPRDTEDIANVVCKTELGKCYEAEWKYETDIGELTVPQEGIFPAAKPSVVIVGSANGSTLGVFVKVTLKNGCDSKKEAWKKAVTFISEGMTPHFGAQARELLDKYTDLLILWRKSGGSPGKAEIENLIDGPGGLKHLLFSDAVDSFYQKRENDFSGHPQHAHVKAYIAGRIDYFASDAGLTTDFLQIYINKFHGTGKYKFDAGQTVTMMQQFLSPATPPTLVHGQADYPARVEYFDAIKQLHNRVNALIRDETIAPADPTALELVKAATEHPYAKNDGLAYALAHEVSVMLQDQAVTKVTIEPAGPGDNAENGVLKGRQLSLSKEYVTDDLVAKSLTGYVKIAELEFDSSNKTSVAFLPIK